MKHGHCGGMSLDEVVAERDDGDDCARRGEEAESCDLFDKRSNNVHRQMSRGQKDFQHTEKTRSVPGMHH